jgi:hypothetical protein
MNGKRQMTFAEFNEMLIGMFKEEIDIGKSKGREYGLTSRLANFTRLGDELGIDPKIVLWVYLKKHLDAILSYITTGGKTYSESIDSRVLDARVYLSLFKGLIEEERMQWRECAAEKLPEARRDE